MEKTRVCSKQTCSALTEIRALRIQIQSSVLMGEDQEVKIPIYLPDSLRSRHVHILGATGSGKTESVILNFLKQDMARGFGGIILDAKGDDTFLKAIRSWDKESKVRIFDLSSKSSLTYNPLAIGSPIEAAQRLFTSMTWSEEYYRSKASSTLQRLFQYHFEASGRNPTILELDKYLADPKKFSSFVQSDSYPEKLAEKEYTELAGLRDQIKMLTMGHLEQILSPEEKSQINLGDVYSGSVFYFRLQSLLSPQLASIVGKLVINHLNYMAGTAHRDGQRPSLVPVYLDEFASFVCPEFADLISKARSAGFALHFSHQSIGDLKDVSKGFLNQITNNSAIKIVLRISDPDSAELLARTYGTKIYQKMTQRVTNTTETDLAEVVGEGSQREAHQFRASPDLFKTLPTGMGSVLIAHGLDTPHGASTVFKVKFPKLL